ncbi:sigma-Y antisigma factor component [Pontibacillus yanchengensis]|uniref:Sigma-Y antisigma factor component n=2 Tax=Pontibacillus yanchengensis TaxID=462910 RepID=A0A6I5A2R6_9BACI|nr:sigma-Y antisigma factor component [Pontibacillus yanchengensis]MYL32791.1 sigma-Y antisigma factor component [Pontibacillus yanchengensis]MYL55185.1 sigma-Y antisigma factor component [Pontibacillus yanchengensis]
MTYISADELPIWGWVLVGIILLTQSSFLFIQAKKKGKNQWLWGLIGIIQVPVPLIIFLLLNHYVWSKPDHKGD